MVRGSCEGLGLVSLARDLGVELKLQVLTDSSAAMGICRRSGVGKVRHLAVGQLWVQERVRCGDVALFKVAGQANPADILTKSVPRGLMDEMLRRMYVARAAGRATSAPEVQS